jgi:hypothetical protein
MARSENTGRQSGWELSGLELSGLSNVSRL